MITEDGFLLSPCYSLELCIQMGMAFLFPFAFHFSSFSAICKTSSDSQFAFVHFFFSGIVLIYFSCMVLQEKALAHHSSTLAWKIPWEEEPGRLQSMGSLRVGHS